MEQERRSIRIGLTVIACAAILRIICGGFSDKAIQLLRHPTFASLLFYMETGRLVNPSQQQTPVKPPPEEQPDIQSPSPPETELLFRKEDAALVDIRSFCDLSVDTEKLLTSPLQWDLTQDSPTVLILHTHTTESYTQSGADNYTESSAYHTLNNQYNMVRIGQQIARILRSQGIGVLHDQTVHDYPSYNGSYSASRQTIAEYQKKYPSIQLVLDLHRDALELGGGLQFTTNALVAGKASSQLMMVVGTNAGGLYHPNWQENMALALKLHVLLEKANPGICRPICLRGERFNQDMASGVLLIEVGAAGDTLQQALTAIEALAESIVTLAHGTATTNSTN